MRRSYISPEFEYKDVYGTFNMKESTNYYGSKMLEIEDFISIDKLNLVYYENNNGEQINLTSENILDPHLYSSTESKGKYHTLIKEPSQSDYQLNNFTNWVLEIDLKNILLDYIFSQIKKMRTFEGIKNNMVIYKDVNTALKNYIILNTLDRYKLTKVDLYIKYNDLRNNVVLKHQTKFDESIPNIENKLIKFQTETEWDNSSIKVIFNQEKESSLYNFNYYFNLFFEKI
jgi:hypothetical protein